MTPQTTDGGNPRPPALTSVGLGSEMVIEPLHSSRPQQESDDPPDAPVVGLRRFTHNAKWLLFWMCWAAAVQGMVVNGFVNTSITSIERRFNFKSRTTGLIAGSYDIACLIVCVPMSYLGSRPGASKPRWLGLCLLIMALGSFVFALPHFLVGPYEINPENFEGEKTPTPFCNVTSATSPSDVCKDSSNSGVDLSSYRFVFILGQVLQGVGAVPLYTIGVAFLDESVSPRMSSLYLGIFYAMAVVGPAIGYGLGGHFLQYYVDAPYVDPAAIGVSPSSNRWIGAWWMGFFVSGTAALLVAVPVLMTPSVIPKKKQTADDIAADEEARKSKNIEVTGATAFQQLDGFSDASKKLLKNVSYLALSVAESTEGFVLGGLAAFMPKLIENQFNRSASFSAMLVGAVAVSAGGGGTFLGGWIIKRFKMSPVSVLKFCLAFSLMNLAVCFSLLVYCDDNDFAGVNVQYDNFTSSLMLPQLSAECNSGCGCEDVAYNPVCGADGVVYYSPCYAGCETRSLNEDGKEIFSECSCIPRTSAAATNNSAAAGSDIASLRPGEAVLESCPSGCSMLVPFVFVLLFLMFLTFLISMPNVSATLRCVDEEHRGLALGLQGIAFRLIGTIPAPILFGVAIDNSCELWQETCAGSDGACVTYNNYYQSRYILALAFAGKIIATFSFLIAYLTHKPRRVEPCPSSTDLPMKGYDNPNLDST